MIHHSRKMFLESQFSYQHPFIKLKKGYFVLFCFVVMKSTKPRCFRLCSWCLWKALNKKGCMGLVPQCLHLLFKWEKLLNIEWFLHENLNWIVAKVFGGIKMCFWCSWKDLNEQDLMEFNGKIWIQNVGHIYF
jgi:hypothetical protein